MAHAWDDVIRERARQDAKWGVQDHAPHFWAAILAEECGEFAREAIQDGLLAGRGVPPAPEALAAAREEAVQAAAVALAIVACLDRDVWWRAETSRGGDDDDRRARHRPHAR